MVGEVLPTGGYVTCKDYTGYTTASFSTDPVSKSTVSDQTFTLLAVDAREMLVLQLGRPTSQLTVTQSVTSTSDNTMSSAASATAYSHFDSVIQDDLTSVYPQEEGEVSGWESELPE